MVLGAVMVLVGGYVLIAAWTGTSTPPQPHQDFAGPTDFSGLSRGDVTLYSTGAIALGCGLFALGWWLRGKKRQHRPALPEARAVRDD